MTPTTSDPFIGRLIDGRYFVRSRIARGGMATVFLAKDRRLDRDVALKVMHPHLTEGTDIAARFRREARAAARLAHPGVVAVYDQGIDGDLSYLTMEYVAGHNLRRELRRHGALSLEVALDTIAGVLDALGAAHRAGLIHRDIKPENVLLSQDGGVKVADFGLARAVTEATMASTGNLLGTVAYLSPEIITSGQADARADVYAVGIMLFELLHGTPPFTGDSAIQVAYQHVHSELPALRDLEPWVPHDVEALINAFCSPNVSVRPENGMAAREMLLTVQHNLTAQERQLRSPNAPARSEDDEHTDNLTAPSTSVLPMGVVAHPTQEEVPKPPTTHRGTSLRNRILISTFVVLAIAFVASGVWWYFMHGPGAYTQVPDVVGQTEEQAIRAISSAQLGHEITREHSDDVPLGEVIATHPEPGARVLFDSDVDLVVSEGVLVITVPDLTGMDEEEIKDALSQADWDGTTLTITTEWSRDVEKGVFMSSSPAAGEEISHADPITVVISSGPRPVTVHNVTGKQVEDAISEFEDQNLEVSVKEERVFSDTISEDHVAFQDPEQGTEIHEGDEVTLTVSKGPELFEVPSVTLMTYEEAKEILEDQGFEVEREDRLGGALGRVRFQTPDAGTHHPAGTVVTLTVI